MKALRSNLIFITLATFSLAFFGCKTQKKSTVTPGGLTPQVKKEMENKPYVNSVRSTYILNDSNSVTVYLKLDIQNIPNNSIEEMDELFRTGWILQPDFGIREKLKSGKVDLVASNAEYRGGHYYINFEIPRLREYSSAILVLEFIDIKASRKFTNESFIDFSGQRVSDRYGIYEVGDKKPRFETAITLGKQIQVKSMKGGDGTLYLKKYSYKSLPALSPMSTTKRSELENVNLEWSKRVKDGEILSFTETGNYCISDDSLAMENSFGFIIVNEYYPRLVNVEELNGPLVYMSTNEEINALRANIEPKDKLDLYFLDLTDGNQSQAKQIIRSFYRRVAKANELFTTYKEGWKTDQGMVYTIIGPPSSIQRNGKREVWLYNQSQSLNPIYFTFYRKSNELSSENYELVRYPEYGAYWYPFVEAWRTGSVLE